MADIFDMKEIKMIKTEEQDMEYITLNNGVRMPVLGYGVYQVSNEECERCVLDAIGEGYRSIDTAQAYGNEEAIGNAVRKCGVPREELFLTTKYGSVTAVMKKQKFPSKNPCVSCRRNILTWFLSISLLMTITAPTVRWKKHIKRAGSVRLAYQIFIPTV